MSLPSLAFQALRSQDRSASHLATYQLRLSPAEIGNLSDFCSSFNTTLASSFFASLLPQVPKLLKEVVPPATAIGGAFLYCIHHSSPKWKIRVNFENRLIYPRLVPFRVDGQHPQIPPGRGIGPAHESQHIYGACIEKD